MSNKFYRTMSFIFCAAVAVSFASPCFADDALVPGPGLDARQKLFDRIQQAKAQGIGIGGYLTAFKALEEQVKAGDSEDKITGRVSSINKAVNEQIERAKVLKLQKPAPPTASQIRGADDIFSKPKSAGPAPTGAAAGGAAGNPDMVSKMKEKYGDKLDALPDSIKEKLMNNPDAQQKIMEKLKGQ